MMSPCDDNTFLTSLEYRVGRDYFVYKKLESQCGFLLKFGLALLR